MPIPSLLAFPFISSNASATYVSVSFSLAGINLELKEKDMLDEVVKLLFDI